MSTRVENNGHVGCLDGLRGLAALWVFLSHAQVLSGMHSIYILSWGHTAVDLFMIISGFLMAHNYLHRRHREPWDKGKTWTNFWTRRFFRIAPAYYVLLAIALIIGPWLGELRALIASHYPWTGTASARYTDLSLLNIIYHVTFLFGDIPEYAFRTPLPDWSIGLEMQFYAAFPLLAMTLGHRFHISRFIAVLALAFALQWLFNPFSKQFEMPSFLILKLPIFMIGMLFAYGRFHGTKWLQWLLSLPLALAAYHFQINAETLFFVVLVLLFGLLITDVKFGRLDDIRSWLSSKYGHLFGEWAYSFYLVHLLILIPVAAWLTRADWYLSASGPWRFLLCTLGSAPATLLCCLLLHKFIEKPGILLGKQMLGKRKTRATNG